MRRFFIGMLVMTGLAAKADPRLTTWMTERSAQYARVYETTNPVPVTTWPSPGIQQNNPNNAQTNPVYADVQAVLVSTNFVYVRSSDLASHRMGPWYKEYAKLNVNGLWPENRSLTSKIPRFPQPATNAIPVAQGPIGVCVNGVTIANFGDGSCYNPATGADGGVAGGGVPGNTTQVWIRVATGAEGPILDGGFGHPAPDGGYHFHANPRALRFQLGDNLSYNPTNDTYAEATTNLHHSALLGWAYDGYPIYGPYGYSNAMDATSSVRRMVSGYVARDGSSGTTNLNVSGRRSLAPWAALFHAFTATLATNDYQLPSTNYGPNISASFPLGWYAEDFAFLGDIIKPATGTNYQQGVDYDLDKPNGRTCVTPEFPAGIYAYFLPVDTNGAPAFPYVIGRNWRGINSGGRVVNGNITQAVVTNFLGGVNQQEVMSAVTPGPGAITLAWNSIEGGGYRLEAATDLTIWTTLATNLPAASNATQTVATDITAQSNTSRFYRVTRTALAPYDP